MSRDTCIMSAPKPDEMAGSARRQIMEPIGRVDKLAMQSSQKGSALILALLILVVLTVIGITGANQALLQERMAGNSVQQTSALFAAESGVSQLLEELEGVVGVSCESPGSLPAELSDLESISGSVGSPAYNYIVEFSSVCDEEADDRGVSLVFQSTGSGAAGDGVERSISFSVVIPDPEEGEDNHPAFDTGITSGGEFSQTGNSEFRTGIHSNVALDFQNNTTVHGPVSVGEDGDGSISGGRDLDGNRFEDNQTESVDIPTVADLIESYFPDGTPNYEASGFPEGEVRYDSSDCADLANDGYSGEEQVTFFCPVSDAGDSVRIDGRVENATIITNGTIEVRGGASQGTDGEVNSAFIAQGGLDFRGDSESYATYWTDGDFYHNGGPTLYGSIVAGGEVDFRGASEFSSEDVGNPWIPGDDGDDSGLNPMLGSWKQSL